MARRALRLAAAALALALPACASAPNGAEPPEGGVAPRPVTTLVVDNRGFLDMNIFVLRDGQRHRLGLATGNRTSRFTIPASMVAGLAPLQFLADPVGSSRTPISERIQVREGDEVSLVIMP